MFKIVVNNSRIELYNVDRLNGKKKGLQATENCHISPLHHIAFSVALMTQDYCSTA